MRSITKPLLLLAALAVEATCMAQPNTWVPGVDFGGGARSGAVSFTILDTAYVGTGYDGTLRDDFWRFYNGVWTQRANVPGGGRDAAVGFSIGLKGYIGTGHIAATNNNPGTAYDFYEFNPATNTWLQKENAPQVKYATGFSIGGTGYITGGIGTWTDMMTALFAYDPVTNAWSIKTAFPGPARAYASSFVVGPFAYVCCGVSANNIYLNDLWYYDHGDDSWHDTNSPILGEGRFVAMGFSIGNTGFIAGGMNASSTPLDELWQYSPTTNAWAPRATMNAARAIGTAFTLGQTAYVGTGSGGGSQLATFDLYTPGTPDCQGVPGGAAVEGSACSSGDPCIIGEVWTSCVCGGGTTGPDHDGDGICDAVDDDWRQVSGFSVGRADAVSFTIGSFGYVGTGESASGPLNDLWRYDPASNSWSQMEFVPGGPRSAAVGFAIGSKGYIGTGEDGSGLVNQEWMKDFYEYDPGNNTWTQKPDLGTGSGVPLLPRGFAVSFAVAGKGYVGGGYGEYANNVEDGTGYKTDMWSYDPLTEQWEQVPAPTGRLGAVGFAIGDKGYVGMGHGFGGADSPDPFHQGVQWDLYEFDPLTSAWTQRANLPAHPRWEAAGFSLGSKGYITTGSGYSSENEGDLWSFDPSANTWSQQTNFMGGPRHKATVFTIGDSAYVGTGFNEGNYMNDLYRYFPGGCTVGTPCSGADPCMSYAFDAGCVCVGTLQDSDEDGVCDTQDNCPGTPASETANASGCSCAQQQQIVDDGDPCTLDECLDGNITHTTQDTDGDGVCDTQDICHGFPDQMDGDSDGIPDGCDLCMPGVGYNVASTSFAPITDAGTMVTLGDDQMSTSLPIGFLFNFYGTSYTNFYIASNGFITFSSGQSPAYVAQTLPTAPSSGIPSNLIAACWVDLDPGTGGTISYVTTGTPGSQVLAISWTDIHRYGSSTLTVTAQIQLHEGSNEIGIHSASIAAGNSMTQGVENSYGTQGTASTGRNHTSWTATNDAYRFTPVPIGPGTPCDDQNASTINDVRNASCVCAGTPVGTDADGDGVPDASDLCENTPAGVGVNTSGCSCSQVNTSDNDACTQDLCTNGVVTHPPVNTNDNDVCTLDGCANETITHIYQDADGDFTCDAQDGCVNDPLKTAPGPCGCGVVEVAATYYADADNDGHGDISSPVTGYTCTTPPGAVSNSDDACPTDHNKIVAGACGCGVADVAVNYYADADSDGHGAQVDPLSGFTCNPPTGYSIYNDDQCPVDPLKTAPGPCGCGVVDVATTYYSDADNDGHGDVNDPLAGYTCTTPAGYVSSSDDACPADHNKIAAGACGCGVADVATTYYADADNDGHGDANSPLAGYTCTTPPNYVSNSDDACPADHDKIAPGPCGCGVVEVAATYYADADNDGHGDVSSPLAGYTCITPPNYVSNSDDACPTDHNKIAAGACGCGVADVAAMYYADTDNDGHGDVSSPFAGYTCTTPAGYTNSSDDACPADPNKIAAGVCGCGTPDTDSDNDGTPNCNDLCPNDANKIAPGTCGCGNPEPAASCNDNNACTVSDVIGSNCSCAGTPMVCIDGNPCTSDACVSGTCVYTPMPDADGDGTCDVADLCPSDVNKIAPGQCGCGHPEVGVSCDDGNANTTGDVVNANCVCLGTLLGNDCAGDLGGPAQPGTACTDNNPCTTNDLYNANCACVGTPLPDGDGDGVCDLTDICPGHPDNLDTDGDGIPDGCDPCTNATASYTVSSIPFSPITAAGIPVNFLTYNTGYYYVSPGVSAAVPIGFPFTFYGISYTNIYVSAAGYISFSPLISSALPQAVPTSTSSTIGGNLIAACWMSQQLLFEGCVTTGSAPNRTFTIKWNYSPAVKTQIQLHEGSNVIEIHSTSITALSYLRTQGVENSIGSSGIAVPGRNHTAWSATNDAYRFVPTGGSGGACDDGNPCTVGDILNYNCVCAGAAPGDYDNDGVLNCNDNCPYAYGQIGSFCSDGQNCTYGDVLNASCQCVGTYYDSDGDGTCNYYDVCPFSANTYPGQACNDNNPLTSYDQITSYCGCAGVYSDYDGDGIYDGVDNCSGTPGVVGSGCNDNNPCTTFDVLSSNCTCVGTFQDTDGDGVCDYNDGCPNLVGSPNSPCDDGNAYTYDDRLTQNCTCAGTQLGSCSGNLVKLSVSYDAHASQTTWDIVYSGTNTVAWSNNVSSYVYSTSSNWHSYYVSYPIVYGGHYNPGYYYSNNGQYNNQYQNASYSNGYYYYNGSTVYPPYSGQSYSYPYYYYYWSTYYAFHGANNSTFDFTTCLPNGDYDLRVFDSSGDGINPGGYTLSSYYSFFNSIYSSRIIDNAGNGPGFTVLSKVDASFHLPLGGDRLLPASCDQESLTTNSVISATPNASVTAQYNVTNATSGYQFWIFNPNGGYTRRLFQAHNTGAGPAGATMCADLKLSYPTQPIPLNVLLNVRVRSRLNGVYGEFGPACRLRVLPAPCPTTQLTTTADQLVSCGATGVSRTTGVLWASAVSGANKYQFEFVNANTNVLLRRLASSTRDLRMSKWGTSVARPTCNIPYNVRVRVSFDDGTTYCPFGAPCTVTFSCTPMDGGSLHSMEAADTNDLLRLWPNPNSTDQLHVSIEDLGFDAGTAQLDVIDLFGKHVISGTINVDGSTINYVGDLRDDIADGLYIVNITAGGQTYTQRLVIAR